MRRVRAFVHVLSEATHERPRALELCREILFHDGIEGVSEADYRGELARLNRIDLIDLRELVSDVHKDVRHIAQLSDAVGQAHAELMI